MHLEMPAGGRHGAAQTDSSFSLLSVWLVEADAPMLEDIFADPEDLPRWWASTFLRADALEPGDENAVGKTVRLHAKGLLPHTFRFLVRVREIERYHRIVLSVRGDFEGVAVATVGAGREPGELELKFLWQIRVNHPLISRLVPLARPVFAWNHRWSMAEGEHALRREILRRRGSAADPGTPNRPAVSHGMRFVRDLYRWRPSVSA